MNAQQAFAEAIKCGELCDCLVHDQCEIYAGDFMYMETRTVDGITRDYFKHIMTREYMTLEHI